jgi:hypothetical protein
MHRQRLAGEPVIDIDKGRIYDKGGRAKEPEARTQPLFKPGNQSHYTSVFAAQLAKDLKKK